MMGKSILSEEEPVIAILGYQLRKVVKLLPLPVCLTAPGIQEAAQAQQDGVTRQLLQVRMYQRQYMGPAAVNEHGDDLDISSLPLREAGHACTSARGALFCRGS